jgi:membrane protease YdiL (CAAX protease family)
MNIPDNEPAPPPQEYNAVAPLPAGDAAMPADLRSPLYGFDLIFLVLFYLVTGAVLYLFVSAVAVWLFRVSPASLQDPAGAKGPVTIISQVLLSGATLVFLYALVRSRSEAPYWAALGWRAFRGMAARFPLVMRCLFGGMALAAFAGWAGSFLDRGKVLPMEELFRSRQTVLLLMLYGILVAPVVEETLFRGCVYPVLARRLGMGMSVAVTGILFGLAHSAQLWPGFGQIALLMCVGVVLTYIRARAGTVAASYFVHLGYNSILFGGFYFATGGLHHLPS